MSGRPILRQMLADIEKMGGIEKICEKISEGESIASIARDLGVSRNFLSTTLNKIPSQKEMLRLARKQKAEHFADEALRLADQCEESPNAISKMREQVSVRKWLASAHDPDQYAQKNNTTAIQVNVGDMHLNALKKIRIEDAEDAKTSES
jgi:transposase-like protein